MRAQISIEMILILAAILAVAFILVTQLQKTATEGGQKIENKTAEILEKIDATSGEQLLESGEYCTGDSQCRSRSCTYNTCD